MDVTLFQGSALDLPTDKRVGCIAVGGTADMQLWPGPGADRELVRRYGATLQQVLDSERKQHGSSLQLGEVLRLHPGGLRCDFVAWVATREPEPGADQSSAPGETALQEAVLNVLNFAAARSAERVAFGPIGEGSGSLPRKQQIETIVNAAELYHQTCISEGRAPVVEEVLVCEPDATPIAALDKAVAEKVEVAKPKPARAKAAAKAPTKARATRAKKPKGPTRQLPPITSEEAEEMRGSAGRYQMKHSYIVGEVMSHPKFGIGKVVDIPTEGQIYVSFEGGEEKRLVHQRG